MENHQKKVNYCVICEAEGNENIATEELDIGFGPAPVCKYHYQEHKNDYIEIDEHF